MDSLSMGLLTVVPMFQLVTGVGYDPVWFGILLVTVAEIGLITIPIGMNLFVMQGLTPGLRLGTVVQGILPCVLADIVRVGLPIAVPGMALTCRSFSGSAEAEGSPRSDPRQDLLGPGRVRSAEGPAVVTPRRVAAGPPIG